MSAFRSRIYWMCLPLAVAVLAVNSWGQEAGKEKPNPTFVPKITISKETTWATEPLRRDGFVDYLAVVNRRFGRGVNAENNACVLLYRAMGPAPEGGKGQPDSFFRLMGIEPLPAEGSYYEDLGKWWTRKGKELPQGGMQVIYDQQAAAGSRPWKTAEFPEIAEWLRDNAKILRLVVEAAGRSEYFSPLVNEQNGQMISVLLPGVQKSRDFARALAARAMLRLGEEDRLESWNDLVTLHRLGRLVGRGPTLIEGLVGIAVETIAIEGELRFISETRPTAKFVTRYLKQLNALPARSPLADKLDYCERVMFLDCCHHLARGTMKLKELGDGGGGENLIEKLAEGAILQSVDWDEILKSGNRWFDRMSDAARKPTYREREDALRKLDDEIKALAAKRKGATAALTLLAGKPGVTMLMSDALVSMLLPAIRQAVRAENRIVQRMRNLEVAFALSTSRGEHDAYPQSLADLAPKYLAAPPTDLFNNQPLKYERTAVGYRFYSVGENETDDGGRSFDDVPRGDDLIVQMPKPPPKPNP